MPATISRADYAAMFGPTTGDKLRLADTDLIIEVERDLTANASGRRRAATRRSMARRSSSAAAR